MTKHKTRQPIPVVENPAVPKHAWLVLFDSARRCGVGLNIHLDETTYHAEDMLRVWAKSEGLALTEEEVRPEYGSPYINLKLCFESHGYAALAGIVIFKIRELVRVEPAELFHAETDPTDYDDDLRHDDRMADPHDSGMYPPVTLGGEVQR